MTSFISGYDKDSGHVFLPGKEEALYGRFRLRYSSSFNECYSGTGDAFTNKPKILGNSLESMIYSCENIRRTIDCITEEVYIERKIKEQNARAVWKFKFAPCGLVLDRVTMKMAYEEAGGGQVTVSVSGDAGSPSVLYYSSDIYMTITRLEGSLSLTIAVNMIGENSDHVTRILSEGLHGPHIDYPLDVQIRLKRPDFTIGRSLIFIGLMHSRREPNNGKNRQKKKGNANNGTQQQTNTGGYLNVLIHKAKRLPCRENGTYAEPKVKCTLHGNGTSLKVKSHPASKNLNPTWNERLVIPNVTLDDLSYSQLELQVVHTKSMFKLKSTETLGYTVLQLQNVVGTWKKPVCRNNSITRPHEIRLAPTTATSNNKKISTSTLTASNTFHGVGDLPRYHRRRSEDASFCIMSNDNKSFEEDITDGTHSNNNNRDSFLRTNNPSEDENGSNPDENKLFYSEENENEESFDKTPTENTTDTLTASESSVLYDEEEDIVVQEKQNESEEDGKRLNNNNISSCNDSRNRCNGNNNSTNDSEDKVIKLPSPVSARTTISEVDSDMENITFRDHYYHNLLLNQNLSSLSKSSIPLDDESFEVLPSFRELNGNGRCSSPIDKNVIDIHNTLDESEVDLHHKQTHNDKNSEYQINQRLHNINGLNNLLNALEESTVDPPPEDEETAEMSTKKVGILGELLTGNEANEQEGIEIIKELSSKGKDNKTESEEILYRPKSSLKRSVSYSVQIRNAFKSKMINKRPSNVSSPNITGLETLKDPEDEDNNESIANNSSNNSRSNTIVQQQRKEDQSQQSLQHEQQQHNNPLQHEQRQQQYPQQLQLKQESVQLQLQQRQQQYASQSDGNLNSVEDISGTIDEEEATSSKRRTVSVDNSQLTPSRTCRFEVKSNSNDKNNDNFNNISSTGATKKTVSVKRSHSFSDLIDINKKRDKKFNKRRNFSNKLYRSGSVSNILDDFFEEKAKMLSHEHWKVVTNTPEQWYFCWHPLLGVNNLLSNW